MIGCDRVPRSSWRNEFRTATDHPLAAATTLKIDLVRLAIANHCDPIAIELVARILDRRWLRRTSSKLANRQTNIVAGPNAAAPILW